jgi:type III restriction enzyme
MLNKAYAKLSSKFFAEAANALRDRLVDIVFDDSAAEANIDVAHVGLAASLYGERRWPVPQTRVTVAVDSAAAAALKVAASERVMV